MASLPTVENSFSSGINLTNSRSVSTLLAAFCPRLKFSRQDDIERRQVSSRRFSFDFSHFLLSMRG